MSAFVIHDTQGEAKSIATGTPPDPLPSGITAKVITDPEFSGLTGGTHRWDVPSRSVQLDTAKAQDVAERSDAEIRLRNSYNALRQWAADAAVIAAQGTNVTQAQHKALFDRFGKLCNGLADLLRADARHQ